MSEITVDPGEIQGAINEQEPDNPIGFGNDERTKITLNGDPSLEFSSDTDPLPIELGYAVTLDMNGRDFNVYEDSDIFKLQKRSWLWNGRINYSHVGSSYSGTVFELDTNTTHWYPAGGSASVQILNVDTLGAQGNNGTVYYLDAGYNKVNRCVFNRCSNINCGSRWWHGYIDESSTWMNGNFWQDVEVVGGDIQVELQSTGDNMPIKGNHVSGRFVPNANTDWHCHISGGLVGNQQFDLYDFPDPGGYDEGIVKLDQSGTDRVQRNLWVDHSNVPHPNNSYGHNQAFFVDNTDSSKANAFDSWMWDGLMYGSTL